MYLLLLLTIGLVGEAFGAIGENDLVALPNKVNHQEATHLCRSKGMNLIKITDAETNTMVYNFAVKRNVGRYWIDGNDIANEGQWVHNDGSRLTYSNWHKGEPNNYHNEDCAEGLYYKNGLWNDINCNAQLGVICYIDRPSDIQNNQFIALPNKYTHQEATLMCKSKGLKLIKIQDDSTNRAVLNFAVRNNLGRYWIDGNDIANEGQWVYNDGSRMTYTHWHRGEPNNYNNEDCAEGYYYKNEFWNDINCNTKLSAICYREDDIVTEPEPKTKEETVSILITNEKASFNEALQICKSNNLRLIRIDDAEMDRIVHNSVLKHKLGSYWIDGADQEGSGKLVDSNGNVIKYKNFNNGQSDSSGCISGTEGGKWNIVSCDETRSVLCFDDKVQ